jgi:hypothetical protein
LLVRSARTAANLKDEEAAALKGALSNAGAAHRPEHQPQHQSQAIQQKASYELQAIQQKASYG